MTGPLTLPLGLYRAGMAVLEPATAAVLAARLRRGKEDRTRLAERRGHPGRSRPAGRLAWLHGASVGETISLLPVVERLTRRGFSVLVTSGTVTSAGLLARRLPPGAIHQFMPLDVPRYLRRFLDHWAPNLVLVAESEIWPNTIVEVSRRGIPLIMVNARLSERSFRRWQRLPKTAHALLERFDLCLAQSQADGERIARLGAPRVVVAGNLKFDVPAPPADPTTVATLNGLVAGRPVWAATSTHPGEEEMVAAVHRALQARFPSLLTIIAPRHPERGEQVAAIAAEHGLRGSQRSRGLLPDRATDIYVADTIGELGLFYRLAPVVFVGGSLVPRGGQNPIEPAKLGAALMHGPYVHNFTDVYAAIDRAEGALPVNDARALAHGLAALLADAARVRRMARAAAATVDGLGGAVERTMRAIEPYILQMHLEAR
ncbi:3-deoxy-D-manno-octulosonic acid transferase [Chelatococcus sp. SYSU_G07232]|uniref:3-deoxy-D-manno-octulosonic acid transferase n=1 Tax=Chelatococcus albus TaxID=3047466 RepID=A0ABT7AN37_9HYPH|nr:3-deoxy-D-manno-octulosonic acid transferase [Chelatococcus sp. SYSU_G07232]MDJ1160224.1 3-deoxy-D-manno-octulosonic acid transferase [Chelatococcus sp. SYSU_G07232]